MRLWDKIKSKLDTPQKREQWGWAMYDWANAAYVTSAAGVFAGPYVTSLAKEEACIKYSDGACSWCDLASACINSINATMCSEDICGENSKWCCDKSGHVPIGTAEIGYGSFYSFTMAAAVIVQIFLLPILGAMADYANNTKKLFMICTYTSATFLILMFFVHGPSVWWLGGLLLFGTTIFFGASSVFYDSFLNLIADVEDRTWLSSAGYGIGYAGGGLFLGINMVVYNLNDSRLTVRLIISAAGIWWVLWSILTFANLREHKSQDEEQIALIGDGTGKTTEKKSRNACVLGCLQLIESLRVVKRLPYTIVFLISAAFFQ